MSPRNKEYVMCVYGLPYKKRGTVKEEVACVVGKGNER